MYQLLLYYIILSLILHTHWEFSDTPRFAYPNIGDTLFR